MSVSKVRQDKIIKEFFFKEKPTLTENNVQKKGEGRGTREMIAVLKEKKMVFS